MAKLGIPEMQFSQLRNGGQSERLNVTYAAGLTTSLVPDPKYIRPLGLSI